MVLNMAVKTERITILTTTEFKVFLQSEASNEDVSVSELVRRRCMVPVIDTEDEELLGVLVEQFNHSTEKARKSLSKGLRDVNKVLTGIKVNRA